MVRRLYYGLVMICGVWWAGAVLAQGPKAPLVKLSAPEKKAAGYCLDIIRGCQLGDGAFSQVGPNGMANAPVWIPPYFANYAALALLAAHEHQANPQDVARVLAWLDWSARNQEEGGYWNDFEGRGTTYQNTGKVDAWDSSAAMFLLVAGRHHRIARKTPEPVIQAARRAMQCLAAVTDESDGLTWAKPDYQVKYLMDNIEVYAGMRSAAFLFAETGNEKLAKTAKDQAAKIAVELPKYWQPNENLFAYALHPNGDYEGGLQERYPHGLAQLFGLAFVAPTKTAAWEAVKKKFKPDNGALAAMGPERWLTGATPIGGNDLKVWRGNVVKEATRFDRRSIYIYRPAVAALTLLEGVNWFPSVANGQ